MYLLIESLNATFWFLGALSYPIQKPRGNPNHDLSQSAALNYVFPILFNSSLLEACISKTTLSAKSSLQWHKWQRRTWTPREEDWPPYPTISFRFICLPTAVPSGCATRRWTIATIGYTVRFRLTKPSGKSPAMSAARSFSSPTLSTRRPLAKASQRSAFHRALHFDHDSWSSAFLFSCRLRSIGQRGEMRSGRWQLRNLFAHSMMRGMIAQ